MFRRLLSLTRPDVAQPSVPAGERVYAIGDVHGRLDLLDDLLERISADDAARTSARSHLVLVGDLIDRGPDSRGVIDRVVALQSREPDVRVIMGNHEEMLLGALRGDANEMLRMFVRNGGRETLLSYGVSEEQYELATLDELRLLARDRVPDEHVRFLESLEDQVRIGDYLFVHAGIRPGVALADQSPSELRWIRREFLDSRRNHGVCVVHGHSIADEVDIQPNRIGIDTGAYATGRLSALALEGTDRWVIATDGNQQSEPNSAG